MLLVLLMMMILRWLNGNFDAHWSLLDDWEWNVLFVDDWTVNWNMNWVWNWLLDVVWNLAKIAETHEVDSYERTCQNLPF
jgi:hypothetical protein